MIEWLTKKIEQGNSTTGMCVSTLRSRDHPGFQKPNSQVSPTPKTLATRSTCPPKFSQVEFTVDSLPTDHRKDSDVDARVMLRIPSDKIVALSDQRLNSTSFEC